MRVAMLAPDDATFFIQLPFMMAATKKELPLKEQQLFKTVVVSFSK
jgi:hypothetical protein